MGLPAGFGEGGRRGSVSRPERNEVERRAQRAFTWRGGSTDNPATAAP